MMAAMAAVRASFVRARKVQSAPVVHFDHENSFPECAQCGVCCRINVLAMTREEVLRIHNYLLENDIQPIDRGAQRCCLQAEDGSCLVWPARAQVCKLHHCKVARLDLLAENPDIHVHDDADLLLVDMHEHFVNGCCEVRDPEAVPTDRRVASC
ncbi:YkgJ family cysteine cluster protein [Adlercreutzia murintestinalis]|uniref:YkgJ family cysteine cluster protein n=1 Tax=Adlercreutzia murintestinalis TaxID=2941325 RepID=UPI00203BB9DA|nr:YkgJ family cysteine cluster protein [Adlercreutzia murintestinalis]